MTELPSPDEVEAARSPKGGYSRAQLAAWGVPWPPPKGWKAELAERWKTAHPDGVPAPRPGPTLPAQETFDFG